MRPVILSILLALAAASGALAQPIDRNAFTPVHEFVKAIGPMEGHSLKDVIDTFNTRKYDEVTMVYAIYTWVGNNIAFDCRAFHHPGQADHSASAAIRNREATAEGYAALFQTMCDLARIHCVTIKGYGKSKPASIGALAMRDRHVWNAIRIRNTWYYADLTWAAGYTDRKVRRFTKEFTDAWIFTNRDLFVLSHFPDDKKWQFVEERINKAVFTNAPLIHPAAVIYEILPWENVRGRIKGKEGDCKRLVFDLGNPRLVGKVGVQADGIKYPADFYIQGDMLSVDLPFPEEGSYPMQLLVNDKIAFSFIAEARPAPKRR